MARILIVEDEALIAELLAMYIEEMGYQSIGPAATVAQALALVDGEPPTCAILDCLLGHEDSAPVAKALANAGIPFAFATGRGPGSLPDGFKQRPMINKPYIFEDVQRVLTSIIS